MKKYIATFALAALLAACGSDATNNEEGTATEETTDDITQNPDYAKGLELISNSDCLTCHKATEKLVGPSYAAVADKYAGVDTAVSYLAQKIIVGGKGNWDAETGGAIMTSHPQLSQADAEQMVKYILLLKNQ